MHGMLLTSEFASKAAPTHAVLHHEDCRLRWIEKQQKEIRTSSVAELGSGTDVKPRSSITTARSTASCSKRAIVKGTVL